MKTIVIYYSFGGATRKEAEKRAGEFDAVVCEVKEAKERSLLGSFFPGCLSAMRRKASKINPIGYDLKEFDRIMIGAPIWAEFPAPAFNAVVDMLPEGKDVDLFFCSGGGREPKSEQGTKDLIASKGCRLVSYTDIKTNASPSKEKR